MTHQTKMTKLQAAHAAAPKPDYAALNRAKDRQLQDNASGLAVMTFTAVVLVRLIAGL